MAPRNTWIEHCKSYASKHGCSYKEAMSKGKKSYKGPRRKMKAAAEKKKRGGKKGDKSKTDPGDMDYTTKSGDKDFHEDGEDVKKKKRPYKKKKK